MPLSATIEERAVIKVLAIAISQRLREIFPREVSIGSPPDHCIYHLHTADFEFACEILWRLGGASPGERGDANSRFQSEEDYYSAFPGRGFPAFFYIHSKAEIEHLLDQRVADVCPPLNGVIEAYLGIATDYGSSKDTQLPTPRHKLFHLTAPAQRAPLEAFVSVGYARKEGEKFGWTDKIAPIMIKQWLWDETDLDWSSVDKHKVSVEKTAILSIACVSGLSKLRSDLRNLSVPYRALEILQRWNGNAWSPVVLEEAFLTVDEAMAIALALDDEL